MAMSVSEAYEVKLNIKLGRGGEPEDFVQSIASILKSRLRKSGRFPDFFITSYKKDSLLVIMGVPRENLEQNLTDMAQKGVIHGYTFGYNISQATVTRAQAEENEIASLEALLEERDAKLAIADRRQKEAAAAYEGMRGENKLLEQKIRELAGRGSAGPQPVEQKVFVPFFQVPHEALAEITHSQSTYIRVQDANFECAFQGITPEEALELMKMNQADFLSARLNTKIAKKEDAISWMERQDHSRCETTCLHIEQYELLGAQYGALQSLHSFMSTEPRIKAPLVYLLADEISTKGECTIYLPIGKSDGWLTKQMRDHVTETLMELYGKGMVRSNKDLKVDFVRKISAAGASSGMIEKALLASQAKYPFSKFGYQVKIVTFKEVGVLQAGK